MPKLVNRSPKLRRHHRGQGVVTIGGKDHYCGRWKRKGTKAPRAVLSAYKRVLAEYWESDVPPLQAEQHRITILEVIDAYWRYAKGRYQRDGAPTNELGNIRNALHTLKELWGSCNAVDFGPTQLQALQAHLAKHSDLIRGTLNRRINRVKRMFKWAKNNRMIPGSVYDDLKDVEPLYRGQTTLRESEEVKPIDDSIVEQTVKHLSPVLAAMVRFQRRTGCRPGEACALRPIDVDRSKAVWIYKPPEHKTSHLDKKRVIYIGPRAQEVLAPYLLRPEDCYCFSPIESGRKRSRRRHEEATGRRDRRKRRAYADLHPRYSTNSYRVAIYRACDKAGVERWSPNRLRHTAATEARKEGGGLDVVQVMLGHARQKTSEIYAEPMLEKTEAYMLKSG